MSLVLHWTKLNLKLQVGDVILPVISLSFHSALLRFNYANCMRISCKNCIQVCSVTEWCKLQKCNGSAFLNVYFHKSEESQNNVGLGFILKIIVWFSLYSYTWLRNLIFSKRSNIGNVNLRSDNLIHIIEKLHTMMSKMDIFCYFVYF